MEGEIECLARKKRIQESCKRIVMHTVYGSRNWMLSQKKSNDFHSRVYIVRTNTIGVRKQGDPNFKGRSLSCVFMNTN